MRVRRVSGILVFVEGYSKGGYLEVINGFLGQLFLDGKTYTLSLNRGALCGVKQNLGSESILYSTPATPNAVRDGPLRLLLKIMTFLFEPVFLTYVRQLYISWRFRGLEPTSVVVSSGGLPGGVWLLPQLRWARRRHPQTRTIVWVHSMYASGAYLFEKLFLRQLERELEGSLVVAPSKAVLDSISMAFTENGIRTAKVNQGIVIPNQLSSMLACKTKRWEVSKLTVVCPALVQEAKGQDVLLDALISIRDSCPGVHVICFGDQHSEFTLALRERATEFGVGDRFEIHPFIEDKCALYSDAQLVVLPSRKLEAFGMVLLEAMSLGIPVMGSDVGGIPEVIGGKLGLHRFSNGDWKQLGLMISRVANSESDWSKLSLHSQRQYLRISNSGRDHTLVSLIFGKEDLES